MLAGARAGADAVDVAIDALSGTTSQPSMGAIVASLDSTDLSTGIDRTLLAPINDYWETTRGLYAPFESGQMSGSADVYDHEMPGGQYTNLMFQSKQLGLADQWPAIKKAYATANQLLGDIVKVTPSSKVAGDLAQFMVQNKLSREDVEEQASTLSFPQSVIEYFQGYLGIPHHGFPEPLRTKILQGKTLPNGKTMFEGRPGEELPVYNFEQARITLQEKFGSFNINETDVLSHAIYPAVFDDYMKFQESYGSMQALDTRTFLSGLQPGEEMELELEHGKTIYLKLIALGEIQKDTGMRDVIFELNGHQRVLTIPDKKALVTTVQRPMAISVPGSIGAPMPGVVVEVKVEVGQEVEVGDPLVVLSAMKMETVVAATVSGTVTELPVVVGDSLKPGELLVTIA